MTLWKPTALLVQAMILIQLTLPWQLTAHIRSDQGSDWLLSNEYLSDLAPIRPELDHNLAGLMAKKAKVYGKRGGKTGKGMCLKGVRLAIHRALLSAGIKHKSWIFMNLNQLPKDEPLNPKNYSAGQSAENFRQWAKDNPITLCQELGLEQISQGIFPLQKGMVLVYQKGTCGYHRKYGHIEIVTEPLSREVCSDFCRAQRIDCVPDLVLIPTKTCRQKLNIQPQNSHDTLAHNLSHYPKNTDHSR